MAAVDVAAALAPWLAERFGVAAVELDDVARRTEGFSWQTYTLTARWTDPDGATVRRGVAIRRQPEDGLLAPYDIVGQYRLHELLRTTAVPVPALIGLELDPGVLGMPFYAMDEVRGIVPVQWRGDDPAVFPDDAARHRLGVAFVDTLADIHAIEWRSAGLDAALPGPGRERSGDRRDRPLGAVPRPIGDRRAARAARGDRVVPRQPRRVRSGGALSR